MLLPAHEGTGAQHFLGQHAACRASEGVLSGHSPHLKSLLLLQVMHLWSGAHILLRVQETHLGGILDGRRWHAALQTGWGH